MSIDSRLREGLAMIEKQLPDVDTVGAYDVITKEIASDNRRRLSRYAAIAAAVVLAAAGVATALVLNRDSGELRPAPTLPTVNRVTVMDLEGTVSYVAGDGSRHAIPVHNVDRFALSPDGRQIAYLADNKADMGGWLWIAAADGTDRHRVKAPCHGCLPGLGVGWSPDGMRIAYTTFTPGKRPMQLRVLTLATGQELVFPIRAGMVRGPEFSPDGRMLAMVIQADDGSGEYVATMDLAAGLPSLTLLGYGHIQVQHPTWSDDGNSIYFTASETDANVLSDSTAVSNLYAVDADGSATHQITRAAAGERFFGAEPEGDWFLITHAVGDGPLVVGWLSADGTSFTELTGPDGKPVTGSGAQLQPGGE